MNGSIRVFLDSPKSLKCKHLVHVQFPVTHCPAAETLCSVPTFTHKPEEQGRIGRCASM